MKSSPKEVITFKVDVTISQLMQGIENRSDFIRAAILNALDHLCPFCKGSGILTPHRKKHWKKLTTNHRIEECGDCFTSVPVCEHD